MTVEETIAILEDAMDLDEGTLKFDSVLEEFEEWDSLSKLSLIAATKQECGLKMGADDIKKFKTVGDICDFLR